MKRRQEQEARPAKKTTPSLAGISDGKLNWATSSGLHWSFPVHKKIFTLDDVSLGNQELILEHVASLTKAVSACPKLLTTIHSAAYRAAEVLGDLHGDPSFPMAQGIVRIVAEYLHPLHDAMIAHEIIFNEREVTFIQAGWCSLSHRYNTESCHSTYAICNCLSCCSNLVKVACENQPRLRTPCDLVALEFGYNKDLHTEQLLEYVDIVEDRKIRVGIWKMLTTWSLLWKYGGIEHSHLGKLEKDLTKTSTDSVCPDCQGENCKGNTKASTVCAGCQEDCCK